MKINTKMWSTNRTVSASYIIFLVLWLFVVSWCSIECQADYTVEKVYIEEEKIGLNRGDSKILNISGGTVCRSDWSGMRCLRSDTLSSEAYSMDTRSLGTGVTPDTAEQIEEEIRDGEIEYLAQLIEAEAGTQDYYGKCLVGDVVINRVYSDTFPNSITEVIDQYLTDKDGDKHYQFSTVIDGSLEKAGWYISEDSFKAAWQEYMAERRIDDRILYFTAGSYNPYCTPAYKYGDHYFGY